MESQPTIVTMSEPAPQTQVPFEGVDLSTTMMPPSLAQKLEVPPTSDNTKAREETDNSRPSIDLSKIMADVMKNFGQLPTTTPPIPEKAKEEATASEKPDMLKLVMQYLPTLIGLFSNLSSTRPERGEDVRPTWKRKVHKPNPHPPLIVQIIIGKLSFIVGREKKDLYKVSFAKDGVFHKKKLTAAELYHVIRTVTKAREENVHCALIFKDSTVDNRTLEPVDITKKTLKAALEYFLCLL
jgi:hypothetical protein